MPSENRDKLFRQAQAMIVDFTFDESVAQIFPDMIRRSVPGYDGLMTMMGLFSAQYTQANSLLFDLGCSTGATSLALSQHINVANCKIIAVDNSPAMTQRCVKNLSDCNIPVDVICSDIIDITIKNASVVTLNFTLQFIAPEHRSLLLKTIYDGLNPGGILVLSEKIVFETSQTQTFNNAMHQQFKSANGYSELEIAQKRTSLENVLIPDTIATHIDRLQQAGFSAVNTWYQCFNFISVCAQK